MSDKHWHRPAIFVKVTSMGGTTFYVYRCECGQELPERRVPAPGITVPRPKP